MKIQPTAIPEVIVLTPDRLYDARGFFSETYNRKRFAEAGIELVFVQDNHSYSADVNTIRGLHYQIPPRAQGKLVRVVRGAILDIAVDVRQRSPTFGRHASAVISAEAWNQILIPVGFAHGFRTLEPHTEIVYKTTDFYSHAHERGILWSDPDLAIEWGVPGGEAHLSDRDLALPRFREAGDLFSYPA